MASKSFNLSSALLRPQRDFENLEVFPAELNAHGSYSTERFVLRLSPKVHSILATVGEEDFLPLEQVKPEVLQAYSTFIHETIHWWQHKGSTSGLILSLQYPSIAYNNSHDIRQILQETGPKKS